VSKFLYAAFVITLIPTVIKAGEPNKYTHNFVTSGKPATSSAIEAVRQLSNAVTTIGVEEKLLNYRETRSAKRGAGEINIFKKAASGTVLILTEEGSGSGALITDNGYVITNQHVVGANETVKVIFKPLGIDFSPNKLEWIEGKVEKVSVKNDLALVKVDFVPQSARPISMHDATPPEVGADAHAIGHPVGELWTYTRGYVSQVRSNYRWSGPDKADREATVIQTQTPINPGNSGGPLLDSDGELIGLNSFKKNDAPGINYAVSTDTIQNFLKTKKEDLESVDAGQPIPDKRMPNGDPCGKTPIQEVRDKSDWLGEFNRIDYDPNCVGRATLHIAIPDDQGKPIVVGIEHETVNGVIGTLLLDEDRDNQIDITFVDVDGDGKFDFEGYNKPGEKIASELNRINS